MSNEHSDVKARIKKKLERDLGDIFLTTWHDPKVVEMMLNADGCVWVERLGEPVQFLLKMSPAQSQAIIESIAGYHGKEVTKNNPILEGEFPLDSSRFAGQLPPVVPSPTFAIRKKAVMIFELEQYVDNGILSIRQYDLLVEAVRDHQNILVVGGTGSGKTTLVNAIIQQMVVNNPMERIIIIEDTGEIQCSAQNYVQYHTSVDVSMTKLLKTTLRMRPDRILVGEVRGEEALDLLDAWNTGHAGGVATLHANSAIEGLTRLKSLVSRNKFAPKDIEQLIGEAVHIVVHISRTPTGRKIQEVLRVSGYENNRYIVQLME